MDFEVRQLLSQAAFHGITRKEIAARAGISANSFTNWKHKSPNLGTLKKAEKALQELIEETEVAVEKYMYDEQRTFVPHQTPFLEFIGKTNEKVEG